MSNTKSSTSSISMLGLGYENDDSEIFLPSDSEYDQADDDNNYEEGSSQDDLFVFEEVDSGSPKHKKEEEEDAEDVQEKHSPSKHQPTEVKQLNGTGIFSMTEMNKVPKQVVQLPETPSHGLIPSSVEKACIRSSFTPQSAEPSTLFWTPIRTQERKASAHMEPIGSRRSSESSSPSSAERTSMTASIVSNREDFHRRHVLSDLSSTGQSHNMFTGQQSPFPHLTNGGPQQQRGGVSLDRQHHQQQNGFSHNNAEALYNSQKQQQFRPMVQRAFGQQQHQQMSMPNASDVQVQKYIEQLQKKKMEADLFIAYLKKQLALSYNNPNAPMPPVNLPSLIADYYASAGQTSPSLVPNSGTRPLRSEKLPAWILHNLFATAEWKRRNGHPKEVCVFCRNNSECEQIYSSHSLKNPDDTVACPILQAYTCPLCNATGQKAHTIKYCPQANEEKSRRQTPAERLFVDQLAHDQKQAVLLAQIWQMQQQQQHQSMLSNHHPMSQPASYSPALNGHPPSSSAQNNSYLSHSQRPSMNNGMPCSSNLNQLNALAPPWQGVPANSVWPV